MNVIYSVKDYVSNVFHQNSGSGAIDVVAVQQPDGSLRCSPFHVHFGKFKPEDKQQVTLEVNGQVVDGVRMKLGAAGEAYFVHQVQEPVDEKDYLASPLPSPLSSIGDTEELDGKRNESSDRLTWGWGALPSMRPEEEADDELPSMVKSASVYFDAVDIEATAAASGNIDYYDHPSMSLCGHLLAKRRREEEMHRIFSKHIVTFDFFRANPAKILANPDLRFSTENASKSREDLISGSSLSRSTHCHTLEPLHEVLSDDGGSTQDTASISSEPYFKKSLKPSREELLAMSLCVGMNDVAFVLRSHDSGELARITAKLYLWPVTAKIVIAQIDGAISSGAATGSMFKRRDPAAMHPGAVEFYSKLARNGYRVVVFLGSSCRSGCKACWFRMRLDWSTAKPATAKSPPLHFYPRCHTAYIAQISASMFGNNVMEKIKRADSLSVQLERSNRFMDAMHTYEQAAKMLLRCIQKREEASGVIMDELKWLRIDYEIRCVQLVALCMCGARKTATVT
ncbi:Lipin, middle domain [Phytophthora cactorum]|nr:Lipin, middle domain [Phytophthora cactorum]